MGGPKAQIQITQICLVENNANFQYLSGHQFYVSSENVFLEVTQGQKL